MEAQELSDIFDVYIKDIILIKRAMLVTWVKCQVIFENGDKNVKLLFALQNKAGLHPSQIFTILYIAKLEYKLE